MSQEDEDRLVGQWLRDLKQAETDLRLEKAQAERYAEQLDHWMRYLDGSTDVTREYPARDDLEAVVRKIGDADKRKRDLTNNLESKGFKPGA